ncbi:uncharacterized protein LOC124678827 [Lolium rigidum]|uniref:uncharacterized protein LOC124678827 n=1 Tax=Lolium rigidum TaxID=89674 RepID=UPI001F5C73D0|nr:uncharacterized protein LOC124678827 [Lolium rigidum]
MRQYFFLEINRTRGKTDTVTACIALDDDVDNTCNACPSHSGILHPCKGGFTCGSKEATPTRALDGDVVSPGIPAPLPTRGNETLGPTTRRLPALVGGGTSRPGPPTVAAIVTPPKSKSLAAMPNGRPGPITKRHLEIALALDGGGTSSNGSSKDNPKCK